MRALQLGADRHSWNKAGPAVHVAELDGPLLLILPDAARCDRRQ